MRVALLAGMVLLLLAAPGRAAPEVPEAVWARDAVAALAARGLVDAYPDGTFRGDRAASRYEVAMLVARILARMEADHADFASREDSEAVRHLAGALRPELEALGVRVTGLEWTAEQLQGRVSELERITFHGLFESRAIAQTFWNTGAPDNDNGRRGGGLPGGVPFVDYNAGVGTAALGSLRPQTHGILPVVDYWRGRLLNNGTGFTARLLLGMKIRVSPEIDADAEFAAYTSRGDAVLDAYWGVPAPYLSNAFTAEGVGAPAFALQPLNNQPYTRMTLDHAQVRHKPSKTRLRLGALDRLRIDPLVYAGQSNNSVWPPARVPGFGFQADGEAGLLRWEVFGSRLGTANLFLGSDAQHQVLGADLEYAGTVRLNFVRQMDEAPPGGPNVAGLIAGLNVPYGASPGWSVLQWVNPPGFFAAQRSAFEQAATGTVPNAGDTRPIAGWNGAADNALGLAAGGGNFGPQGQAVYGVSLWHEWKLAEDTLLRARAEWAHSDYRPNRNSPFTAGGEAMRAEAGARLLDGALDLSAWVLSVDPDYSPYVLRGGVAGVRQPRPFLFAGAYQQHDTQTYPGNRQGFGLQGLWKFDEGRGAVTLRGSWLDQKRTSLYDVRAVPGSAGSGAPNFPVLGFAPGFRDDHFPGFASPLLFGPNSASSFTDALQPLEDPRGRAEEFGIQASYEWEEPGVRLEGQYSQLSLRRPTSLSPGFGGSQNRVDIGMEAMRLGVAWEADERWTWRAGVDRVRVRGHHDPAGLFNAYAVSVGTADFANLDSTQIAPSLGAIWEPADGTLLETTITWYSTRDAVPSSVWAGRALDTEGATAHPFQWEGLQVMTRLQFEF